MWVQQCSRLKWASRNVCYNYRSTLRCDWNRLLLLILLKITQADLTLRNSIFQSTSNECRKIVFMCLRCWADLASGVCSRRCGTKQSSSRCREAEPWRRGASYALDPDPWNTAASLPGRRRWSQDRRMQLAGREVGRNREGDVWRFDSTSKDEKCWRRSGPKHRVTDQIMVSEGRIVSGGA